MAKRALVDPVNDRVVQFGPEFPVAEPLKWVDVPSSANIEDFWNDADGHRPPPPKPPGPPPFVRSKNDPLGRLLLAKGLATAQEIDNA